MTEKNEELGMATTQKKWRLYICMYVKKIMWKKIMKEANVILGKRLKAMKAYLTHTQPHAIICII